MANKASVPFSFSKTVELDPASVAANTVASQEFTVAGLRTGMIPLVSCKTLPAGLGISHAWVSAKDTLQVAFVNPTGDAINATARDFDIFCP